MARVLQWCCVLFFVAAALLSYGECRKIGGSSSSRGWGRPSSSSASKPKPLPTYNRDTHGLSYSQGEFSSARRPSSPPKPSSTNTRPHSDPHKPSAPPSGSHPNQQPSAPRPPAGDNAGGVNKEVGWNVGSQPNAPGAPGSGNVGWNVPGHSQQPAGSPGNVGWNVNQPHNNAAPPPYPGNPSHGHNAGPPPYPGNPSHGHNAGPPPPYSPYPQNTQHSNMGPPPPYPGYPGSSYHPNQPGHPPPAYQPGHAPPGYQPGHPAQGYPGGYQPGQPGYSNVPGHGGYNAYPGGGYSGLPGGGYGGFGGAPGGFGGAPGGFGGYGGYHGGYGAPQTSSNSFFSGRNVLTGALLGLTLYSLTRDHNNYHYYYPNSRPMTTTGDSASGANNIPQQGSFATQIGNMTCLSVYNAKEVNKWATNTLNDFHKSFPKTPFPVNANGTHEGFNFTVVPGDIIHNETLGVTCCGTDRGIVNLAMLTSGKNKDVNCIYQEFNMPFRRLRFIPINSTVNATAANGTAVNGTAINGTTTDTNSTTVAPNSNSTTIANATVAANSTEVLTTTPVSANGNSTEPQMGAVLPTTNSTTLAPNNGTTESAPAETTIQNTETTTKG